MTTEESRPGPPGGLDLLEVKPMESKTVPVVPALPSGGRAAEAAG